MLGTQVVNINSWDAVPCSLVERERQTFCGDLLQTAYPADADGRFV